MPRARYIHPSCLEPDRSRARNRAFARLLSPLLPLVLMVSSLSGKSREAYDTVLQSPRLITLKSGLLGGNRSTLDKFWAEVKGNAPLVEKGTNQEGLLLVTFLWRDRSENPCILLQGGPPSPAEKRLTHLPNTDLWFRTELIPEDARFTYGFEIRTNQSASEEPQVVADPLNSRSFDGRSFVELPKAPVQPWIDRLPGVPQGKIAAFTIPSAYLREERSIGVYTPANYSRQSKPCNLLLVFDGQSYRELVPLPIILDNLISSAQIPGTVAIGIPNPTHEARQRDLHCYQPFADFLAKELIPWARRNYHVSSDPRHVVVAGSSAGGLSAAFCAFRYPRLFGNVLSQSGSFWYAPGQSDSTPDYLQERGWLTRQFVCSRRLPLRFFLETGRFEIPAQVLDHHRIRDVLEAKGYSVIYREYNGGHDYFNWRGTFGEALIALTGEKRSGE